MQQRNGFCLLSSDFQKLFYMSTHRLQSFCLLNKSTLNEPKPSLRVRLTVSQRQSRPLQHIPPHHTVTSMNQHRPPRRPILVPFFVSLGLFLPNILPNSFVSPLFPISSRYTSQRFFAYRTSGHVSSNPSYTTFAALPFSDTKPITSSVVAFLEAPSCLGPSFPASFSLSQ